MIPHKEKREITGSAAEASASFEISKKNAAHIMTILRDTLYSDKVLAVLREYSSNAWDANRSVGKGHVPIKVTLPTANEPELRIRDYGPGLSLDDVLNIYTQYGDSSKRGDNNAVGMLGIGSKAGFAYSDTFTITSWHGGEKAVYVAVIDSSEKGRLDLLYIEPCDENETGLEIQIAVKPQDVNQFTMTACNLFRFFEPYPDLNVDLGAQIKTVKIGSIGELYDLDNYYGCQWHAVMGCIPYEIDLRQLEQRNVGAEKLHSAASRLKGVVHFDIGDLQIAASRESLKYGDETKDKLVERINQVIDKFVEQMLDGIDLIPEWERLLRIRSISRKYLPIPAKYNSLDVSRVALDDKLPKVLDQLNVQVPAFTLHRKNYADKVSPTASIEVSSEAAIYIKDVNRAFGGYKDIKHDYVIVFPRSMTDAGVQQCKQHVNAMIKNAGITGVPVRLMSTLKWESKNGPRKTLDSARAKARTFVLDPNSSLRDDERSRCWIPQTRMPTDSDIFVVLDGYRVDGRNFFEDYRRHRKMVEAVGGKMPPIYGYKTTVKRPVTKTDCKGTHYYDWKDKGMVELILKANPQIAKIVDAYGFPSMPSTDAARVVAVLGDDHMVSKFVTAANRGMMLINKANPTRSRDPEEDAITYVRQKTPVASLDSTKMIDEIKKHYPLLGIDNCNYKFSSNEREMWIEYVRSIDALRKLEARALNEEAA